MHLRIIFLIYLVFPSLCFQPQPVKVLEATTRVFTMGREESGSGVEYKVRVKVNKGSEQLSFTRVWVGSKSFVPEIKNVTGAWKKYFFQKGDELLIVFIHWSRPPTGFSTDKSDDVGNPAGYKGEGLIVYQKGRKEKSALIPVFRKLPEEIGL